MLKVCTSYSKKVPTDQQYSSQQFHASVEVELSDALSPDQLQERIHQTFSVVRSTVEAEITGKPSNGNGNRNGNGNGNGHGDKVVKATNPQVTYITSMATEQRIELADLNQYIHEKYGADSPYEMTKQQASELVKQLQRKLVKIPVRR
jgi:hypothetical protein